jgi:hypothetical protein
MSTFLFHIDDILNVDQSSAFSQKGLSGGANLPPDAHSKSTFESAPPGGAAVREEGLRQ